MKKIFYQVAFGFCSIVLIISCKKNDMPPSADIHLSVTSDTVEIHLKDTFSVTAMVSNNVTVSHEWKIDDTLVSQTETLTYVPSETGVSTIRYKGTYSTNAYTKKIVLVVLPYVRPVTPSSSKYISNVYAYVPAPGQFINEDGIGTLKAAKKLIGGTDNMITLGAYGGYVVFGFDHSVINKSGYDFAVYGNPLPPLYEWSEAGIVMVSVDNNGNGIPDDAWYELAGSSYKGSKRTANYSITYYNPKSYANVPWKDNQGNTGEVLINNFHTHNYYPLFVQNQDSLVFTGSFMKSTFKKYSGTSIYINTSFNWGYADSYSTGDDYATNKYNSFDLDWAVNANGKKVKLSSVDFVKIYTAQNCAGNDLLGEISTEVRGARDLNMN